MEMVIQLQHLIEDRKSLRRLPQTVTLHVLGKRGHGSLFYLLLTYHGNKGTKFAPIINPINEVVSTFYFSMLAGGF